MPRYIALATWTDRGFVNSKDTTSRADAADNAAEKCGGPLVDISWTMGPYDLVVTMDAPDDKRRLRAAQHRLWRKRTADDDARSSAPKWARSSTRRFKPYTESMYAPGAAGAYCFLCRVRIFAKRLVAPLLDP